MYKALLVIFLLALSACNMNTSLSSPENDLDLAYVSVSPAPKGSNFEYIVQSKTILFYSYSMRERADREKYLRKLFRVKCRDIEIMSESEFTYGRFVNGNDNNQYNMNVACLPA